MHELVKIILSVDENDSMKIEANVNEVIKNNSDAINEECLRNSLEEVIKVLSEILNSALEE